MYDPLRDRKDDKDLYRGLRLSDEEGDWVKHYLRVADQVLFGRRPAPRVMVIDKEEWDAPRRRSSLIVKKKPAA